MKFWCGKFYVLLMFFLGGLQLFQNITFWKCLRFPELHRETFVLSAFIKIRLSDFWNLSKVPLFFLFLATSKIFLKSIIFWRCILGALKLSCQFLGRPLVSLSNQRSEFAFNLVFFSGAVKLIASTYKIPISIIYSSIGQLGKKLIFFYFLETS